MDLSFFSFFHHILSSFRVSQCERAVALIIVGEKELENIFTLLLLGSFVGMPAPPTFLAVELMPFMKGELKILSDRAKDAGDMLAEMCGTLGID